MLAQHPQHFADMGGDLRVLGQGPGPAQLHQRLFLAAQAIQHPAIAVDDGGVVRLSHAGAVDQLQCFLQAAGAIGQGVTQRVQSRHVLRIGHQDLAQIGLGARDVVAAFPGERTGVQQAVVIRVSGQAAGQRIQFTGAVVGALAQFRFQQVGVAAHVVVNHRIGLDRVHLIQCQRQAPGQGLGVGRAQARFAQLIATGHAVIPLHRLGVTLEVFGDLAQQQALRRVRLGRLPRQFIVEVGQRGLVALLGQQRSAHAPGLHVLRAERQHALGGGGLAEAVIGDGHGIAQFWVLAGFRLHVVQQRQRLAGLARLLQLAGTQQRHTRFFREALDHFIDHAPRQVGLVHAQGKATELLPGFDLRWNGVGVDQLTQHLRGHRRIAAATDQGGQGKLPAALVGVGQQALQFGAGSLHIALTHGQRTGRTAHGQ